MNAFSFSGFTRTLIILFLVLGFSAASAFSATVQWEILSDRDRVTITLNKEEGFAGNVTRVSPKGLLLDLGVPTAGMIQELAPENARFFAMSEPRGRALGLFMKTAAFGYAVTRPDRHTVIINAFSDPLGERWTPNGLAPETGSPSSVQTSGTAPPAQETAPKSSPRVSGETPTASGISSAPAVLAASAPISTNAAAGDTGSAKSDNPAKPEAMAETPPPTSLSESTPAASPSGPDNAVAVETSTNSPPTGTVRGKISMEESSKKLDSAVVSVGKTANTSENLEISGNAGEKTPNLQASTHSPSSIAKNESADPTVFRAAINTGSLEEWGKNLHEAGGGTPSEPPHATGEHAGKLETPAAEPPKKIYVDESGKEVPPPPDPVEAIAEVRQDIGSGKLKDALEKVTALRNHPELNRDQTEEILHLYSELLFIVNQGKLAENYDIIVSATITAMNYNQDSPRNAAAYLRLGYLNMQVGNIVEADAYFTRLRRQFPMDENIPLTYYYWGEYYYARNEMQKAADEFQFVVSRYTESKYARDATLGLARTYAALGYYKEANDIVLYIEKRWPRLYLDAPSILELMGDIAYRVGNFDFAVEKYLTYYNLLPTGPSADVILTRIGDVFARERQMSAAKAAYVKAEKEFPDKDGGLVAMMRLAEVGINDKPQINAMFSIFDGYSFAHPAEIYKKIIKEHPQSELVPLAELKLAMWYLWRKSYEDALNLCNDFITRFPNHELKSSVEEVALKAFTALAEEGVARKSPGKVLQSWKNNPVLLNKEDSLDPASRLSLGMSMWQQNDPDSALEIIKPLFLGRKDSSSGEPALLLALNIYLDHDQWQAIEKLAEQIGLWELTPKTQQQLDYALALAKENQGKSSEAATLWKKLGSGELLPEKQQAYVEFFLEKDAENNRNLQDAYAYGRSALNRFLQIARENPDQADTGKINSLLASLMDIAETSGRLMEALEYANQYLGNLQQGDSQRQSIEFRIAGIYRKQGNTAEWRKTLTGLAEKYPDSVHGRAAASALRSSKLTEEAARFAPGGQL